MVYKITYVQSTALLLIHIYGSNAMTTVIREVAGPDFPSVRQIASESALVFVNSDEFLDFARPILHKTIYIGGIGIGEPEPLNQVLFFPFRYTVCLSHSFLALRDHHAEGCPRSDIHVSGYGCPDQSALE